MARPRTPSAKAKITGQDVTHKPRFESRNEPDVEAPLGDPPAWVQDTEKNKAREAWHTLSAEIPWLNSSHRTLVAMASSILGRMIAGQECGVQALNLLRQTLGQMGATPADASKVGAPTGGKEVDPAEKYFQ
ncbi:hypothetical protein E2A64_10255 [Pseudohoeflea suaedae]|uniref:Terminase n=1 Tax=Pseudohoeflea suaedae TaxID=877384 RepID=A0A4R5PJ86_9HYPH|nr:hypothetical protein [Pseudohoeflea suaedae]TDH35709.1 hypothetical protein E2A64_10255 [Pseudohoeflea suaedae]